MKNFYKLISAILVLVLNINPAIAKTVKYEFDIDYKNVNFTGKEVKAMSVAGQIPAPTISAQVGDTLEVTFNNKMNVETSIHWHGVLLPNDQDGVPHLNTKPIAPNATYTYVYKVTHSGTYWYHSHTNLQEQRGIYGSLIFHPKDNISNQVDQDHVIVLSDWSDENPNKILSNLKKDGDYYALKKDSVQSWSKVLKNNTAKNRLKSSWSRMGPMDLSDVGYDLFLMNGKKESSIKASKGEKLRLRLVNAGASSYFNIEIAELPMRIVSADGMDVEPLAVKRFRIAIAETYDVIVTLPDNKSYELRATSEDGTGYSSIFIGNGEKVFARTIQKPNLLALDHSMHNMYGIKKPSMKMNMPMDHSMHNMGVNKMVDTKNQFIDNMTDYKHLRAVKDTTLPKKRKERKVVLHLTGNMEKYVWSFNNKTLLEESQILIKKGEIVRFILRNKTMMHHPIHLHGHFFRVLNGQGARSPLKHTVNVAPMETVTIEFEANEEKDWFFHCHNLYHAKTGMARVVSYQDTSILNKKILKKMGHDKWFSKVDIGILSNMSNGMIRTSNSKNAFEVEYDYNYKKAYDIDAIYLRSINRFLDIYTGGSFERESKNSKSEEKAIIGIRYTLPLLIESDLRLDSKGKVKLALGSDIQLTDRTKFKWQYDTNKDYRLSLVYEMNKKLLLDTTYDSKYKWGAGIRLMF